MLPNFFSKITELKLLTLPASTKNPPLSAIIFGPTSSSAHSFLSRRETSWPEGKYAHLRDTAMKRAFDLAGNIIEEATKEAEGEEKKVVNLEDSKR